MKHTTSTTKDKRSKKHSLREFTLTRAEVEKLYKITEHFKEINIFTVIQDSSSGIGCTTTVKFNLFDNNDTAIDVTDIESW
jgi:hypothetical protein